jgi:hypothetical protein
MLSALQDLPGLVVQNEQRQTARKVLKVKALLAMDGQAPVWVRTCDINASGLSLGAPGPLPVGGQGQISFDLYFEGKSTSFNVRSKVQHCFFSSGEFRIGFQFLNLELSAMTALAKFLR